MKKYILFLGLSVVPLLSNAGMPGNFYVGAGLVSTKPTQDNVRVFSYDPGASNSLTAKLTKESFISGRFQAGYHKEWNKIFMEAEAFGQTKDRKETSNNVTLTTPAAGLLIDTLNISVRRNYTLGAALKVGRYVTDRFGIYLSGGALNSKFRTSVFSAQQDGSSVTSSQSKSVWGGVFGGGLIARMGDSFVLKAEYGYEIYKRFKTHTLKSYDDGVSPVSNILRPKMNFQSATLSVSYLI